MPSLQLLPSSERTVEEEAISLLAWHGVLVKKNVVQQGRYAFGATGLGEGSSDLVGVDRKQGGRAVFIEMKRKGEKATDKQLAFIREVRAYGAVAGVAWSAREALDIVIKARVESTPPR